MYISMNGGDGGVVVQRGKYGTISGNICNNHFGPGINIENGTHIAEATQSNIHINENVCIKNCRRTILEVKPELKSRLIMNPEAGGIAINGDTILITNNQCCDPTLPSTSATQLYGLVITKYSKNITVGSDMICPNFFIGPIGRGGDIFDKRPDPDNTALDRRLKTYDNLSNAEISFPYI